MFVVRSGTAQQKTSPECEGDASPQTRGSSQVKDIRSLLLRT